MSTFSPPNVFISHSHKNRDDAFYFKNLLEENGAKVYLDQDEIEPGDVLPSHLQKGINNCTILLLLWSRYASWSKWVEKEWNYAYEKRKKIIPYLLDESPLPNDLEDRLFIEQEDRNRGHGSLLQAIFGKGFTPPGPTIIFPGNWIMEGNWNGLVGMSCEMELRKNGQLLGTGKINLPPVFRGGFGEGMSAFLNSPVNMCGSWSYVDKDKVLKLEIIRTMGGKSEHDTITIFMANQDEEDCLLGTDMKGASWTLKRIN